MHNTAELLHCNMLAAEELPQLLIGFEQEIKEQITGQHQNSIMTPFNSHLKDLEPSLLPLHPGDWGLVDATHHLLVHAVIDGLCLC